MILLSLALFLASFFTLPQPAVMFLELFAIIYLCFQLHASSFFLRVLRLFPLLAAQSILQTAWYYVGGKATMRSDLVILAMITLVAWAIKQKNNSPVILANAGIWEPDSRFHENDRRGNGNDKGGNGNDGRMHVILANAGICILALAAAAFILWQSAIHGTTDAIRTPWPLMPHGTLAMIAFVGICALLTARFTRSSVATGLIATLSIVSVTTIAFFIYQNGYGYDGFIHRASEQIFLHTGTLSPKPPYYIGQYVFTTWLARTFSFPVDAIDNALVPFAAALVPLFAAFAFEKRRRAFALTGLAFLLPLGAFITTTPQSFSYLLGLAAVFLALSSSFTTSFLFALWAVAAHPLGGLPFLGAVFALWFANRHPTLRALRSTLYVLTILSVPLAFAINSLRSGVPIIWNFRLLSELPTRLLTYLPTTLPLTRSFLWPDWASFVEYAAPLFLVFLACYAWKKNHDRRASWSTLIILGMGTAAAGVFLNIVGDFSFLIAYERGQYAERLFIIAALLLLPAALDGFAIAAERLFRQPKINILAGLVLLMAWRAGSAYIALPRHDAAVTGHGWSVGRADQDAVRWIDEDAGGRAYTVLANQSVSAAAVQAFGFKRYAGEVFYYPVPTGGELYQLYLRAAEKDQSRATAHEAATLGKSDLVYVVLNDYWWKADQTAEALEKNADASRAFGNNRVRVYRFDFNNAINRDK